MASEITPFERRRSAYKGKLTKLESRLQALSPVASPVREEELEELHNSVTSVRVKVRELDESIFLSCSTSEQTVKAVDESDEIDVRISNLLVNIKLLRDSTTGRTTTPSTIDGSVGRNSSAGVRLPKLELPLFEGDFVNWQSFQDLFTTTVDNNTQLSGAQKLQYLKSCVKNDALQLIKSYTITDSHYDEAWAVLKNRYDNTREITHALIKKMLQIPQLRHESSAGLQKLLDVTTECLRSLKVIGRPTEYWDDLIVYNITERLDPDTRRQWAVSLSGTIPPTLVALQCFLEQHIRGLIAGGQRTQIPHAGKRQASAFPTSAQVNDMTCLICKDNHPLYRCTKFISMEVEQRRNRLKGTNYCFNCLKPGHSMHKCLSKSVCRTCSKKHNTLLHLGITGQGPVANTMNSREQVSTLHTRGDEYSQVLLKTAMVQLTDNVGNKHIVRAFLDSGSEASFITEHCVQKLGIKRLRTNIQISGLSSVTVGVCKYNVKCIIASLIDPWSLPIMPYVVKKIGTYIPSHSISSCKWSHINDIELADPQYYESRHVDLLLGAEVVAACVQDGVKSGSQQGEPTAINTTLGWVLCGRVTGQYNNVQSFHICSEANDFLQNFWKLDKVPEEKHLSPQERECENHFLNTHRRDSCGRYVVQLPFNQNKINIGPSRSHAMQRFLSLEKRLRKNSLHRTEYNKFMYEYEQLGHMTKTCTRESPADGFYLPHHYVIKNESTTTKLRVVFDGSAKSQSGFSLNDALNVGPTIQDELLAILLRFRTHRIAIKADITKMYRQFIVEEADSSYQKILWRKDEGEPIEEYRLTTVTYGTSSAPFLATRCVQQLATDEKCHFPIAAEAMQNDMYVDDLLSGGDSIEEAVNLYQQLMKLINRGGMQFSKWMSSHEQVMKVIPANLHETQNAFNVDEKNMVATLGVKWVPTLDSFSFKVPTYDDGVLSKRKLLSNLAKIFDPIGFLSPFTVTAKIILQDIWKAGKDWDDEIDKDLVDRWQQFRTDLSLLVNITVPRVIYDNGKVEIHGFSDSSEKAYCGVVYMRTLLNDGTVMVRMVVAKTKVAPLKSVSLPRLELCGALLLANLIKYVLSVLKFTGQVIAWTDSSVVMGWLASYPARWCTFVANRVSSIQDTIDAKNWRFVPGHENPADCGTRGMTAEQLSSCSKWWEGPSWLSSTSIPTFSFNSSIEQMHAEEKKVVVVSHTTTISIDILNKYSSMKTMLNIIAYVRRFIKNCRYYQEREYGTITVNELESARTTVIKLVQQFDFHAELERLKTNKCFPSRSQICQLNPFIDDQGILRVGGRLQKANASTNSIHPIILPSKCNFSAVVVRDCHQRLLHGGFQLIVSTVRQQYWILHCRRLVRKILQECMVCKKYNARSMNQLMGSLPSARVNISSPFNHSGVDYAGPFNVIKARSRGVRPIKCYLAVFICFSTKAVHLEYVSDLTCEAFVGCLKRFTCRRGLPTKLYSDNATNFVKANKVIQLAFDNLVKDEPFAKYLANQRILWSFIPPASPHHGGLWESAVRSVKYHLKRVIGLQLLTIEEFQTLLTCVEGILNSRPICAMSPDPLDLNVLTPGHFLIGRPLNMLPNILETSSTSMKSKWNLIQQMTSSLWNRWQLEYRNTLQERFKWKHHRTNLKTGDLVLIHDKKSPVAMWKLGRIVSTYLGTDNLVRVVDIKTINGLLKRSISNLTPIMCE